VREEIAEVDGKMRNMLETVKRSKNQLCKKKI